MAPKVGTDNVANRAEFIYRGEKGHELWIEARGRMLVVGVGLGLLGLVVASLALYPAYSALMPAVPAVLFTAVSALMIAVPFAYITTSAIGAKVTPTTPVSYHWWVLRAEARTPRAQQPTTYTMTPAQRLTNPTTYLIPNDPNRRKSCVRCDD